MTTISESPPTATMTPPPAGVPAAKWNRAVELIRSQAVTSPSFWALWCRAYRLHLRGFGDGVTFLALFGVYQRFGGTGGPYGAAEHPVAGPGSHADAMRAAEPIDGTDGRTDAVAGQEVATPYRQGLGSLAGG